MKVILKKLTAVLVILLLINVLSYSTFKRFDFTSDQRFTLSGLSEDLVDKVESPMLITVFLKGEMSSEFKRLQRETQYMLEELNIQNSQIQFQFVNPIGVNDDPQRVGNAFYQNGLMPENLSIMKNGKLTKTIIFPWAIIKYQGKEIPVHLLNKKLGTDVEKMINSSVQNLEYAFADAILKLSRKRIKKIAVLRSKGELEDDNLTDFLTSVSDYYLIAQFSLDSVQSMPEVVQDQLNAFDAIIEAKPTKRFTDKEIFVLDQYIMQGGKAMWFVDNVTAEKDSLKKSGSTIAFPKDLNLTNLFFKYGVRINYDLINDVYSAPIYLSTGNSENTQLNPYPWFYEPLVQSRENHPIVSNLNAVKFEFANSIDTLKNSVSKTVLLSSSDMSRAEGVPREVSLQQINTLPDKRMYPSGNYPLAVLLEGEFSSAYKNLIPPFELKNRLDTSVNTQQVFVSDGDIVRNDFSNGNALSLGFDRFTGDTYGNKTFLINALNYIMGDEELVFLRNKTINIPMLSEKLILEKGTFWQSFNLFAGAILIVLFGGVMFWFRKLKLK